MQVDRLNGNVPVQCRLCVGDKVDPRQCRQVGTSTRMVTRLNGRKPRVFVDLEEGIGNCSTRTQKLEDGLSAFRDSIFGSSNGS